MISDHNPEINRDTVLNKGLFTDRLGNSVLNNEDEIAGDAMANLPKMFSDAVLYRVVKNMDNQLKKSHTLTLKEHRQFLDITRTKTINAHRPIRNNGTYI